MNIKNKIFLYWSVEDPVYSYQNTYEYTVEEFSQLNMEELREQQQLEYADWLAIVKSMEQGQ